MKSFSTRRLIFEAFKAGEERVFKQVYGDPESVKFVGDGKPISDEACTRWIRITLQNYNDRGYGMLKVRERSSGKIIGCAGIVHPGNQKAPEIKYCFLKNHWGQGFATETVKGLMDYAARNLGLHNFVATVAAENFPSQKVLLKCGFEPNRPIREKDGSITLVFSLGNP